MFFQFQMVSMDLGLIRKKGLGLKDSSSDDILSSSTTAATTATFVAMQPSSFFTVHRAVLLLVIVIVISISCFVLYKSAGSLHNVHGSSSMLTLISPSFIHPFASPPEKIKIEEPKLEDVLRKAEMRDGTMILTTLNEAWAAPGSVLDLFFESFEIGKGTSKLLKHLVIIALDAKVYSRCREVHKHCFSLETKGVDWLVLQELVGWFFY